MQSLFPTDDSAKYLAGNALVCADNIDILRELPSESVDLIYLDPPFQSDTHYVAIFGDKGQVDTQLRDLWKWTTETERVFHRLRFGTLLDAVKGIRLQTGPTSPMAAYCVFMVRRLLEMHRVLKPAGSLYLHCDYHANHFLRVLLDAVFGVDNFKNEITWQRTEAHNTAGRYGNVADTILYYTKSDVATWNQQPQGYGDAQLSRFRHADDGGRKYKLENLTAARPDSTSGKFEWRGNTPGPSRGWGYRLEQLEEWWAEGRIQKKRNGTPRLDGLKVYLDQSEGKPLQNIWTDISRIPNTSKERVGYPTQKPLALLERIIEASSNKGDLVLDPFCGCGTAADAAAKLGRKYLGIDISAIAVRVMEQRLASRGDAAKSVVHMLDWSDWEWEDFERRALQSRDDAEDGTPGWAWAEDKVAGLLNAVPNSKKTGDGGIDARYFGEAEGVIPIQVKMHQRPIGRPDLDKLLGAQTAMRNKGINAPMSLMVSLYEPPRNLRTFAAEQGRVELHGDDYPVMQALSVQEMLTNGERPKLPPVDPRSLVGNTQTRMVTA